MSNYVMLSYGTWMVSKKRDKEITIVDFLFVFRTILDTWKVCRDPMWRFGIISYSICPLDCRIYKESSRRFWSNTRGRITTRQHSRRYQCMFSLIEKDHMLIVWFYQLDLQIGKINLRDRFEWDLENTTGNAPEIFSRQLAAEVGLGGEYVCIIAHAIREQLYRHKRQWVDEVSTSGWIGWHMTYITIHSHWWRNWQNPWQLDSEA